MRIMTKLATMGLMTAGLIAAAMPASAEPTDPPSRHTIDKQRAVQDALPFSDREDYDFAARGFLGTRGDPVIRTADGRVAYDLSQQEFAKGPAPATVNPSLWRQAELLSKHGLFQVTDRVYQVRGFDLANVTFIKGDSGWIVIDPLTSIETARAAYDLVTEKLGKRPVSAIVFTHSHGDHFGGGGGLVPVAVDKVPILAPAGFFEAAISENIIAGPAMGRRAQYHLGTKLGQGPEGVVSIGIGPSISTGTTSLLKPTREISESGSELTIDGVRMRFQVTPNTEAPAEMNIGFPDWNVIDLAENANATQHNVLTPRGAQIRNARAWADGLTQAMALVPDAEVMITSHAWPRFGHDRVVEFVGLHRDMYAFLHDQTVRLMNQGMTGDEIAATLTLPPALAKRWYDRPYYGSLSFNSRAVYQYYMGFFDGNPVHLAPLPATEGGRRYVEAIGGAARVRALAQTAYDAGDYAWAAELLNRAVFADPGDISAKALLARCYDQLAWQSETSLWRNFYRTGALELREGVAPPQGGGSFLALLSRLPTASIFDVMATRLDPAKLGDARVHLALVFPDRGETLDLTIANGVLVHRPGTPQSPVDATLTVDRADFLAALGGGTPIAERIKAGTARIQGDATALARLPTWFDAPDPSFAIVTP